MFNTNSERMGKDIPENTLKKTGFSLLCNIIGREFLTIVIINILFVLYSFPIVTIGASYCALNSVIIKLIRNQSVDIGFDFNRAFRENFIQGTIAGSVVFMVTLVILAGINFYWVINKFIMILIVCIGLIFLFVNNYVFPLIVSVKLPMKHIYKNSFVIAIVCWKNSLLALFCGLGLFAIYFLFLPATNLYMLIFGFSFSCIVNSFFTYNGIKKYREEKDEEELLIEENEEGTFANTLNQEFENEFG